MQGNSLKQISSKDLKLVLDSEQKARDLLRGIDGSWGIDGINGQDGSNGLQGIKGIQGLSGRDGSTGKTGLQGPKGDKGDSIAGPQGDPGQDGIGIVDAKITRGKLIITYTDGSNINLGVIIGPPGPQGMTGSSGGVFGNTTVNETNITEEVLSPQDSANLQTTADKLTDLVRNQQCQLNDIETKLHRIETQMTIITDEELLPGDVI